MQISGHRTRSVFDRYDIVSGGDLDEAARKLEDTFLNRSVTISVTSDAVRGDEQPVSH
jgi:hypothetical protein